MSPDLHITTRTPEQRLAEARSCMHWLFSNRPKTGASRRAVVRLAIRNTALAGKMARFEIKLEGI